MVTPCEFERRAGKSASRNWKNSIRFEERPISNYLETCVGPRGKRQCRFVSLSAPSAMAVVTNVAADGAINSVDVGATTLTPSTSVSTDFSVASSTAESTSLPDFAPISDSTFTWGTMDSQSFCHALNCAYQEVVNWKSNCFRIPSGKFGKRFILELARLFRAAGEGSVLEGIAIKAALTLCSLVLQKPSRTSKDKQHISCLERRLKLWSDGNLDELVLEGRTIQQRLRATKPSHECDSLPEGHFARSFSKLMFAGNTN